MSPAAGPAAVTARLRAAGCVFAEDEAALLVASARTPDELAAMTARRAAGEPLEQVVGWAELCGLRIAVDPGVFVPRRRSELLARQAIALAGAARLAGRPPIVLDICCGSGALAAVIAMALPTAQVHAVDIDDDALRCARRNLEPLGCDVHGGDLYEPLPRALRGSIDVIVANAPYVPAGELAFMPAEARLHEPRVALDGGTDGLDVQRRVIGGALAWLAPGGHLLIETSDRQAAGTMAAVEASGLTPRLASSDEMDATVVIGTARASGEPGDQGSSAGTAAEPAGIVTGAPCGPVETV